MVFARRRRSGLRGKDGRPDPILVLRRLEQLARFLDASIGIPGTRFRFGADAILGLFPGGGDVVGAALSGYVVYAAWRLGLPAGAIARMIANIAADTLLGAVPVAGDVFDAWWKANLRNVAILRAHVERRGGPQGGGGSAA